MEDDVETIRKDILQQIKPINFGDELNVAAILGEQFPEVEHSVLPDSDIEAAAEETLPVSKPDENVICHVCSKVYSNIKCFKKHFAKHTGRFSCPTCKKTFARKDTKLKHILWCPNENGQPGKRKRKTSKNTESLICNECNKKFARKENLEQHLMIHNGIQVICQYCDKRLSSFTSFRRHRKIHEQPKQKIACEECPKKFTLKSNLKRHIRFHKHKREIICNKCNAKVKTEFILQKHQSQDTISTCSLCSRLFCLELDFRSHLKKDHPNLWFKCKQCTRTPFMTRAAQHIQTHVKKVHSVHLDFSKCFQDGWFILL